MKGTSPKSQIAEKLKKFAAKTELTIIYYSYEMAIIIPDGFYNVSEVGQTGIGGICLRP